VYEIVWGTPLDPRNFHRKVTGAERFLVDTGSTISSGGRPAQLYRRGDTDVLHPPMLRPRPGPREFVLNLEDDDVRADTTVPADP
jgi:8-oxo-dGTP diphosphatase